LWLNRAKTSASLEAMANALARLSLPQQCAAKTKELVAALEADGGLGGETTAV